MNRKSLIRSIQSLENRRKRALRQKHTNAQKNTNTNEQALLSLRSKWEITLAKISIASFFTSVLLFLSALSYMFHALQKLTDQCLETILRFSRATQNGRSNAGGTPRLGRTAYILDHTAPFQRACTCPGFARILCVPFRPTRCLIPGRTALAQFAAWV